LHGGRDGVAIYFSSDGAVTTSQGAGLSFNNEYNSDGTQNNTGDTAEWTQQAVFGSTGTGETLTVNQTNSIAWPPRGGQFWLNFPKARRIDGNLVCVTVRGRSLRRFRGL
jgi:hypothetical protein